MRSFVKCALDISPRCYRFIRAQIPSLLYPDRIRWHTIQNPIYRPENVTHVPKFPLIISTWSSAYHICPDPMIKGTLATDAVYFRENLFVRSNHNAQGMLACCSFDGVHLMSRLELIVYGKATLTSEQENVVFIF
jgi:hypothetical protein